MNFKNLHEMNQYYERMNHDGLLNHMRIYGNGNNGLGYKPKRRFMIGGMAMRSIDDPNEIVYENIINGVYKGNDNIVDLLKMKDIIPLDEYKNRLLSEFDELTEIYKDANIEGNETLKNNTVKDFKKIIREFRTIDVTEAEDEKIVTSYNTFQNYRKFNEDEILEDQINKSNEANQFYNDIKTLALEKANDIFDKYYKEEEDSVYRKNINDKYLSEAEKNEILYSSNEERQKDLLFSNILKYETGDISEEKLIEKGILLTFIDGDKSQIYDTKDEEGYDPDFIANLKSIGLSDNEMVKQVLSKMNIDGIKDNTIWELKAFSKGSYDDDYKREDYSKAKFRGSKPSPIQIKNSDGTYDLWTIEYSFVKKPNKSKLENISYILKPDKYSKKGFGEFSGYILKPNPKGYNYYIMENNSDRFQYMNPLEKGNWESIINYFKKNPSKSKINIENRKFLKLPKQYTERYNKTIKEGNDIFNNWSKSKHK